MPQVGEMQDSLSVLDPHSGFRIPGNGFSLVFVNAWNLDSSFQSLVGFEIPLELFWIPKPRIPDSPSKNFPGSRNPDSLSWGEKSVDSRHFYP